MKQIDHSWDFSGADTKYYTHGIHQYPAMMIPQVAKRLISRYGKNTKTGYDPFCGSGSVLLEFALAQIKSFGTDINPLALLISKVKTTNISASELQKTYLQIRSLMAQYKFGKPSDSPIFFNINFWFKKQVIKDLAIIRQAINQIQDEGQKDFFKVCFGETVRKVSNTRGGEFKLYRISQEKLTEHNPKTIEIFDRIVRKNIESMKSLNECAQEKYLKPEVFETDVSKKTPLQENSIDMVVSSPPYGDSRTTVAYGQFSRLGLQWLDFDENKIKQIDKIGLGGRPNADKKTSSSKALDSTISLISKKDDKRVQDVISFFNDFYVASQNIEKVMKKKSVICWVVGNRTVKEIQIPTDKIIADFFKDLGYGHEKTIVRSIPSKRMPKKNSPTNRPGEVSSTMNEENIVILKRD